MTISEGGLSTCETVTDTSSWIDVDCSSVTSEEKLNRILNADTYSSVTVDNTSLRLRGNTIVHNRFSLCKRGSSLSYKHFSENDMFSISEKDSKYSYLAK